MLRQFCDDASNIVLIENNGDATHFQSDSIVFNENSLVSIIAQLTLGVNRPLTFAFFGMGQQKSNKNADVS